MKPSDEQKEDSQIKLCDIEAEDFKIVARYLIKGSFSPHVVKGRHGRSVIEGVKTSEDADALAQELAKIYRTASRLHFGALQQHCVDKLRHLPAVSPSALLLVMIYFNAAQGHGCTAEAEMEEWVVYRVSRNFWELVKTQGETFERMMADNIHLRMNVLDRAAGVQRQTKEWEDDWESE